MKFSILSLLVAVVIPGCMTSCATKLATIATPIAPTVTAPAPTAAVDLKPIAVDLKPVIEANRQMAGQLERGKLAISDLNQQLAKVDASRMATLADWQRLTTLGKTTATALDESERARSEQQVFIATLETTVAAKSAEVAAAEQEKHSLRALLVEANTRITKLTGENQALHNQWLSVRSDLDAEKGKTRAEAKWKWRFFWWGTGMTTLAALYVAFKIYKPL
jgi:hypothetical protein